jgi:hypothetical protein
MALKLSLRRQLKETFFIKRQYEVYEILVYPNVESVVKI